jgi:hypothetical protein
MLINSWLDDRVFVDALFKAQPPAAFECVRATLPMPANFYAVDDAQVRDRVAYKRLCEVLGVAAGDVAQLAGAAEAEAAALSALALEGSGGGGGVGTNQLLTVSVNAQADQDFYREEVIRAVTAEMKSGLANSPKRGNMGVRARTMIVNQLLDNRCVQRRYHFDIWVLLLLLFLCVLCYKGVVTM